MRQAPTFKHTFLVAASAALAAACAAPNDSTGETEVDDVDLTASAPGWMGNVRYAIDRQACEGGPCEASLQPMTEEITYGTLARQRAAVRTITFEVWKEGVTDWDNPDLWRELDVQVHTRAGRTGARFSSRPVSFARRLGNNARYALELPELDPIPGDLSVEQRTECPKAPLEIVAGGGHVATTVELYFTVNGAPLRPEGGGTFAVRYENYAGLYAHCR